MVVSSSTHWIMANRSNRGRKWSVNGFKYDGSVLLVISGSEGLGLSISKTFND